MAALGSGFGVKETEKGVEPIGGGSGIKGRHVC